MGMGEKQILAALGPHSPMGIRAPGHEDGLPGVLQILGLPS